MYKTPFYKEITSQVSIIKRYFVKRHEIIPFLNLLFYKDYIIVYT